MPPKRRAPSAISPTAKRYKVVSIGSSTCTDTAGISQKKASPLTTPIEKLRQEFIDFFSKPEYHQNGISNLQLKAKFPGEQYIHLVPIINALTKESRLIMSKTGDELHYKLVNEETASKFAGLDVEAHLVYQVLEESGNTGIWTYNLRLKTNIASSALKKILNNLELRKLIKQVQGKSKKKCYMLYDLKPSDEVTGGPWYTENEFDHEFISELRMFIMHCVRRLNGGKGVTMKEISEKMKTANVSRVQLNTKEIQQLIQTLAFEYMIEQSGVNQNGEAEFIAAKPLTVPCKFKWWDETLCPDFHFRNIKFEDDVVLSAHEPHYHSAS